MNALDIKDLEIKMLNKIINMLIMGNLDKKKISFNFGAFHIILDNITDDTTVSEILRQARSEIDKLIMGFDPADILQDPQ
jgi:hypothetical protein